MPGRMIADQAGLEQDILVTKMFFSQRGNFNINSGVLFPIDELR